jgi:hypothetical protein
MERGSGGSNWIDEEHDNTVRSEHIAGSSQSRLGRMHEKDENNEPICHDNPVFQQTNFRLNETALRELVERMSLLRRVEIGACDVHRQRLETHDSDSIVT